MEKQKVILYLNINDTTNTDKSLPKICMAFNIGVTVFMLIFAILLFRTTNFYTYILFAFFDIIYFILLTKYHKTLWQFPLTGIGLFALTTKLFLGYIIISQYELEKVQTSMFTWLHAVVLVLAIGTTAYFWAKSYQAYKILKDNTIESAPKIIAKKNPIPKWVALIFSLSGSPMILVRLLRDDFQNTGLGLGFCMWTLGIIFAMLFAMLLPKIVVLIRFRVWSFSEYRQ